jgi:hypothetical protein
MLTSSPGGTLSVRERGEMSGKNSADRATVVPAEGAQAAGGSGESHEVHQGGAVAALPARVRWARGGYLILTWIFVGCVAVQVFFAGLAIFVDSAHWLWHTRFIHYFDLLPILMLPLAFAARLPAALRWLTGALYALIWVQYFTANLGGVVGAFHAVNALVIFWVAIYLGQRTWRAIREDRRVPRIAPPGGSPRASAPRV